MRINAVGYLVGGIAIMTQYLGDQAIEGVIDKRLEPNFDDMLSI